MMRKVIAGAALSVAMIFSGVAGAQAQPVPGEIAEIPGGAELYVAVLSQCQPVPLEGCDAAIEALLLAAAANGVDIEVVVAALETEFAGNAAALAAVDVAVAGTAAADDEEDASPN